MNLYIEIQKQTFLGFVQTEDKILPKALKKFCYSRKLSCIFKSFIKAVNKHAHSAEPCETWKVKTTLDRVEQTLQHIQKHPEGLHQNNFCFLLFEDLSYRVVTSIISICNTKFREGTLGLFALRE